MRGAVVAAMLLAAHAAAADPPASHAAQADALYGKGQAEYEAGRFQEAIALFQKAYDLAKDPVYLFNIAQSYRKVLDCEDASAYYQRYLDEAPKAENRAKVQLWITELQPCVDKAKRDHAAAKQLEELERQRQAAAAPVPQPAAPSEPEAPSDPGRTLRIAGIATAGAGAAGIFVGILESIHGASLKSQVARDCAMGCDWQTQVAYDREGKNANTVAVVGWVAGGIAAAGGAALYFLGRTRAEHVTVAPTPGGATASLLLRW